MRHLFLLGLIERPMSSAANSLLSFI
jgi:hypothetical protein